MLRLGGHAARSLDSARPIAAPAAARAGLPGCPVKVTFRGGLTGVPGAGEVFAFASGQPAWRGQWQARQGW